MACKLVFDTVDDVNRADAIAGDDHTPDGFFRAFHQRTGPEGIPDLDLGHLADKNGHAVLRANDNVLDVADVFDEPEATDHGPGAARLHDIAPDIAVTPHDGVHDGRERDTEGAQAVGVHVNLILPHRSPDAGHFGHARHGVELIADKPVLERAQVAEGISRPFHGVPEDVPHPRGIRAEGRHDPRRQRFIQEIEPFEDPRAREVNIDGVFKEDVNHREAKGRGGPHHAHPRQALEAHGQRVGDLVLHFLRRAAGPVREDNHLVVREVRNGVNRHGAQRPIAPASQQQEPGDHQEPIAQRDINKPSRSCAESPLLRATPAPTEVSDTLRPYKTQLGVPRRIASRLSIDGITLGGDGESLRWRRRHLDNR